MAHPARDPAVWGETPSRPLPDRLVRCPAEVIDFVRKDNQFQGYPERPEPLVLDSHIAAEVRSVLQGFSPVIRRLVEPRLAGICFVEHLGGSGYSMLLFGEGHRPIKAAVLLDVDVLDRPANAWFAWRESTPFRPRGLFSLRATIAAAGQDTRKAALAYILLHELGHVMTVGSGFMPAWTEPLDPSKMRHYPYLGLSWRLGAGELGSRWDRVFPLRRRVRFYRPVNQRMPNDLMPEVMNQIAATDFPTLYSATAWPDDFADSLTNYVHVVQAGRPFRVEVLRAGEVVSELGSCWDQPRCAAKRAFFEALLRPQDPASAVHR